MEIVFDPFGTKKRARELAEKEAREQQEAERVRSEESRRYRKERREEKRRQWLGKGLTGEINPYVDEISSSGTVGSVDAAKVAEIARNQYLLEGSLVDVLRKNQEDVNELGLDHRTIVDPLQRAYFDAIEAYEGNRMARSNFYYLGRKYVVSMRTERGVEPSPFLGDPTATGDYLDTTGSTGAVTIADEEGKEFSFRPMLVSMIRDYGFYGKGEPKEIADFFHLNQKLP